MAEQARAVVATGKGAPVSVETIVVPDPGPGEAVVRVQACGVCHTDLHYREGAITDDFPFLLGHEAAGTVEAVGAGVANVAPGDYVVLAWRAPCGRCRSCRRGRPWYCFDSANAAQPMTLVDGTPLSAALDIGAFADRTLVAADQAVKVDSAARPEAAGLIGCGIMAGFGAAANTGNVARGDSVAVIGCGGVGNAAIAGAALAGARRIIDGGIPTTSNSVADLFDPPKRVPAASPQPSTSTPANSTSPCTSGPPIPSTPPWPTRWRPSRAHRRPRRRRGHRCRRPAADVPSGLLRPRPGGHGGAGRRSVPHHEHRAALLDVFGRGGALKSSWYGDCLPSRDFPVLIDLYLQGRLDLDGFVSETLVLDDVEEAFAKMQRGDVLRSVVVL